MNNPMFEKAFQRVVGHEGKFQNNPKDRGNWTTGVIGKGELNGTKFGISAASYPTIDIKNLTLIEAKLIYFRDFWQVCGAERLDPAIVYQLFDGAFHHGIRGCFKMLQRAVGTLDDGIVGPNTYTKIFQHSTHDLLKRFLAQRIRLMTGLSSFDEFGRGWMNRIASNLEFAAEDTPD